jgi:hypothetical protein
MHMALDKKESENLKQVTSMFVLFYKNIWNEVEKQFADLPREEKHKIFGVIAPSIVQTLNTVPHDYEAEEPIRQKRSATTRKR